MIAMATGYDMPDRSPIKKVLIVDGNDLVRRLIRRMLLNRDFEVVEAGSNEQAWQLLQQPPAPDLIVCDLSMPQLAASKFLSLLGQDWRRRAIAITGFASAMAHLQQQMPELTVLQKPFTFEQLLDAIADVAENLAPTKRNG